MTSTLKHVAEHYREEAKKYGDSKQSTMKDMHIRDMEVAKIVEEVTEALKIFGPDADVLEVGCGNGYTAEQVFKQTNIRLSCIDFCEDMINIADKSSSDIYFAVDDVTNLTYGDQCFDIVYSERCLINLVSWRRQKKALDEIMRILRPQGVFLMIEAFTDGLEDLNKAREAVGLEPIPQPSFDLFLDKQRFFKYIEGKFTDLKWCPPNFLSTYYYGTKVIYPSITKKGEIPSNSMFDEFYTHLPPYGNYSPIQIYVLQKE